MLPWFVAIYGRVGGANAILEAVPVDWVASSLPADASPIALALAWWAKDNSVVPMVWRV